MSWQRGPRLAVDPYVPALAIVRAAIAASVDVDIVGTSVVRTMPTPRPAKVVQLRIDGGDSTTHGLVTRPLVTYRVWHTSDAKASELAYFVRDAFLNAPASVGGVQITHVEDGLLPVDVPDPADGDVTTYFGRVELWTRL